MKKKVVLLLTLIVSLFIYSGRVEAIVMWMQCTNDDEDLMQGNDEDYQRYNTFAVINEINSSISTKYVVYPGGSNGAKQINFFSEYGPTYIANIGSMAYTNQKICWFKNPSDALNDDSCSDDNDGPFYTNAELYKGICPTHVYKVDPPGINGNFYGDFLILAGDKEAKKDKIEVLDGYQFALYKYKIIDENHSAWMMEAYNQNGVYGFVTVTPFSDYFDWKATPDIGTFYPNRTCFGQDNLYPSHFQRTYCQYLNIMGADDDDDDLMDDDFSMAASPYVDWLQHVEMIKLYYTGRNYFKLSEYKNYPQVFIANIGSHSDSDDPVKRSVDETVHTYNSESETWQEIKDWANELKSDVNGLGGTLSKFENDGKYSDMIRNAKKVNNAISKGQKFDLNNIDYDVTINLLNNALNDIKDVLPPSTSNNSGSAFYQYRLANESELNSTDPSVKSRIINNCIQDGTISSVLDSVGNYVSCKTVGYPFTYISNNTDETDKANEYPGTNSNIVYQTYYKALNDQLNKETNLSANLVDYQKNLRNYVTILSRYANYIETNYNEYLTDEQKKSFETIKQSYLEYARDRFKIEIILDCGTLIGSDFIAQIEKFTNILKIAIPILLIGFGILDFTKAIFEQDESKMKAAQKKFFMRIAIALLFFLLPVFVKLLLNIANKAWNFISPNTCDIKW